VHVDNRIYHDRDFKILPIDKAPRVEIGENKYLIPAEKATLEEAKSFCKQRNMEVASFDSKEESEAVANFLKDAGLSAKPFMTSAKAGAGLNWAPNHPDKTGKCSVVVNQLMQSASCENKVNFMCESKKIEYISPETKFRNILKHYILASQKDSNGFHLTKVALFLFYKYYQQIFIPFILLSSKN